MVIQEAKKCSRVRQNKYKNSLNSLEPSGASSCIRKAVEDVGQAQGAGESFCRSEKVQQGETALCRRRVGLCTL